VKNRSGIILIRAHYVALIKRTVNKDIYFVFPGGGIEENESPEECARREALEELGLIVNIINLYKTHHYKGFSQYYFLVNEISGEFGTGSGEEYTNPSRDKGTYTPVWVPIDDIPNLRINPPEVATELYKQYKKTLNLKKLSYIIGGFSWCEMFLA
jgi:8-oxo-dGTP diphosphatase